MNSPAYQWPATAIPTTLEQLTTVSQPFGEVAAMRAEWAAAIIWSGSSQRPYPYRGSLSDLWRHVHEHVESVSLKMGFLPDLSNLSNDNGPTTSQRASRLFKHWTAAGRPFLVEGINVAFADLAYRVQMTGAVHDLVSRSCREVTHH